MPCSRARLTCGKLRRLDGGVQCARAAEPRQDLGTLVRDREVVALAGPVAVGALVEHAQERGDDVRIELRAGAALQLDGRVEPA